MNERSSRSHTIFRIVIESLECGTNELEDDGRAVKVKNRFVIFFNDGIIYVIKNMFYKYNDVIYFFCVY